MGIYEDWGQVARSAAQFTPAGPLISPSAAAASVERLRRAASWAAPRIPKLTGLKDAAEKTTKTEPLVVDRHGLIIGVGRTLSAASEDGKEPVEALMQASQYGLRTGTLIHVGGFLGLRQLAKTTKCYWTNEGDQLRGLLVAPNVWQTARNGQLDQNDYSKWVALRSGLWGTYFHQAPWLQNYLRKLVLTPVQGALELVRTTILLSEVVSTGLSGLTPADIASVNWIKTHAPASGVVDAVRQLEGFGIPLPDLQEYRAYSRKFVSQVGISPSKGNLGPANVKALETLLRSVDYLPTLDELANPELWQERVGLG